MREISKQIIFCLLLILAIGCKPKPQSDSDTSQKPKKVKPGLGGPTGSTLPVPGLALQAADVEWVAVLHAPALVAQFRAMFPMLQKSIKKFKSADDMFDKLKQEIGIDMRKVGVMVSWFRETGRDVMCFAVAPKAIDKSLFVKKSVLLGIEIQQRIKGKGYLLQLKGWSVVCDKESSAQLTVEVLKGKKPSLRKSAVWKVFAKLHAKLGNNQHRMFFNVGEGLGRGKPLKQFKGVPMLFAANTTHVAFAVAPPKGRLDAVLQQSNAMLKMTKAGWNKAMLRLKKKPGSLGKFGLNPAALTKLTNMINGLQFKLSGDIATMKAQMSIKHLSRLLGFVVFYNSTPDGPKGPPVVKPAPDKVGTEKAPTKKKKP